jgi:6-phosphogluconolactonase
MSKIEIYPDLTALAYAVAERIVTLAGAAIEARGRFSMGLSGGSTPKPLYNLLATDEFKWRIDWPCVHVFWGDERCVPPDHPDSNYGMAYETLLKHIPEAHIYRIHGEEAPSQAAAQYERVLREFFGQQGDLTARFDLLLQGMGDDGHTASLFPDTAALREYPWWVVENFVPKLETWRITLTPKALNAAANVIFMVAGKNKAETLRDVLNGPSMPEKYPSQIVQPSNGEVCWMVDAAAAALL